MQHSSVIRKLPSYVFFLIEHLNNFEKIRNCNSLIVKEFLLTWYIDRRFHLAWTSPWNMQLTKIRNALPLISDQGPYFIWKIKLRAFIGRSCLKEISAYLKVKRVVSFITWWELNGYAIQDFGTVTFLITINNYPDDI